MRSSVRFRSHPVHPILVAFPIAFFTGCFLFHLAAFFTGAELGTTLYYLNAAGLAGGAAAAIPGVVDLFRTVPPDSSARKRGIRHGLLNTLVMILFGLALWLRQDVDRDLLVFGLEAVAMVLLMVAGFMGGTLVYRNQIGVDIRYADAGKWKEVTAVKEGERWQIPEVEGLKTNQMMLVRVADKRVVVANAGDKMVAFDDRCTHRGASLAGGSMICKTVQCPWHGSQFDTETGAVIAGPAKEAIGIHELTEESGRYYLRLR